MSSDRIEIKLPDHDILLTNFSTESTDPVEVLDEAIDHFVDAFSAEQLAEILETTCLEDIVRSMQHQIYLRLQAGLTFNAPTVEYHDNISPESIVLDF